MTDNVLPEPPDVGAAKLMLLALRAEFPDLPSADAYCIRANGDVREQAPNAVVGYLANIPKPLLCRGEMEDGKLIVDCVPVSSDPELMRKHAADQRRIFAPNSPWTAWIASAGTAEEERKILCIGVGETLCLPVATVGTWHRDYHLSDQVNYGIHTEHLDRDQKGRDLVADCQNLVAVMKFFSSRTGGDGGGDTWGNFGVGL